MRIILLLTFVSLSMLLHAQYSQQKLFPGLEREVLLEQVVDNFKADITFFDYGTSRDTMFRNVYAVDDSLSCVYSGHTLYMDPQQDPTTTVFMNGVDNGINTEHTYPRSKGAGSDNPLSDMHHLFPTRAIVNEERSNFSFGEIDDNETALWFYKDQTLSVKPTNNLDGYSEWKFGLFEPRESHKGNVARAIMYFYTMYKSEADEEDPNFFWEMVPTLCDWHFQDPVDSAEFARTNLIAKWQQYPNPFVLDCSLASRSYCSAVDAACALAVPVENITVPLTLFQAYYLPLVGTIKIETSSTGIATLFDMNGRKLQTVEVSNTGSAILDATNLQVGSYVVRFTSEVGSTAKIVVVSGI